MMKLHYYLDTDSLYIELSEKPSIDSQEIADGVVIDFDDDGNLVGIDIDNASSKLNLREITAINLPQNITFRRYKIFPFLKLVFSLMVYRERLVNQEKAN